MSFGAGANIKVECLRRTFEHTSQYRIGTLANIEQIRPSMFTHVSHPSLEEMIPNVFCQRCPISCWLHCLSSQTTLFNVFLTLLPMSSSSLCSSSRAAVFRVFRVLMPVSYSASCPCLPNPLARYHFVLRLVITLSSRSSSLRSQARVFCRGVFKG